MLIVHPARLPSGTPPDTQSSVNPFAVPLQVLGVVRSSGSSLLKTECVVSSTPSVTITAEIGMSSGILMNRIRKSAENKLMHVKRQCGAVRRPPSRCPC